MEALAASPSSLSCHSGPVGPRPACQPTGAEETWVLTPVSKKTIFRGLVTPVCQGLGLDASATNTKAWISSSPHSRAGTGQTSKLDALRWAVRVRREKASRSVPLRMALWKQASLKRQQVRGSPGAWGRSELEQLEQLGLGATEAAGLGRVGTWLERSEYWDGADSAAFLLTL